jgi:DNA-binding transcriptional ArsR family regulator
MSEDRKDVEKLALITSSQIRIAVVSVLSRTRFMPFGELKNAVGEALGKSISDGNFAWHLEKLKGSGIIDWSPLEDTLKRGLAEELELGEEGRRRTGLPEDSEPGRRYYLTKEGHAIQRAVRDAIKAIRMKGT